LRIIVEWQHPDRTASLVRSLSEAVKLIKDRFKEEFVANWLKRFSEPEVMNALAEVEAAAEKEAKQIQIGNWEGQPGSGSPAAVIQAAARRWIDEVIRPRGELRRLVPEDPFAYIFVYLD
jgi:hypothetical protein